VNIAEASMQRLRNQTGETVGLHWLVGQQRVCLVELTSPHPIRMASGVGQAYPLFAGAAGKAILAWLPVAEVGAVLADASRFPHMKAPTRDALLHDLAKIRKQGYAESAGETVAGAAAVATTILNSSGKPQGALNVTGPADRFNAQCRAQSRTPLLEAVDQIMRQLGRTNSVSR
jgi:DNA-binding IclR family transcriptional regulator